MTGAAAAGAAGAGALPAGGKLRGIGQAPGAGPAGAAGGGDACTGAACTGATGTGAGCTGAAAGASIAGSATGEGIGAATGTAAGAPIGAAPIGAANPPAAARRSSLSSRACSDSSSLYAPGSITRAQISSSCSRGAALPRISVSPVLTMSAARLSSAAPNASAWACITATRSAGASISPFSPASGTVARITRSRSRSSRSVTKRRGSCPPSTTRSITWNTVAPSCAAKASTTSSSSAESVYPSSAVAIWYVTPPSPAPASSWSMTDIESRTEPAPARTTSGNTVSSTWMPSRPQTSAR